MLNVKDRSAGNVHKISFHRKYGSGDHQPRKNSKCQERAPTGSRRHAWEIEPSATHAINNQDPPNHRYVYFPGMKNSNRSKEKKNQNETRVFNDIGFLLGFPTQEAKDQATANKNDFIVPLPKRFAPFLKKRPGETGGVGALPAFPSDVLAAAKSNTNCR